MNYVPSDIDALAKLYCNGTDMLRKQINFDPAKLTVIEKAVAQKMKTMARCGTRRELTLSICDAAFLSNRHNVECLFSDERYCYDGIACCISTDGSYSSIMFNKPLFPNEGFIHPHQLQPIHMSTDPCQICLPSHDDIEYCLMRTEDQLTSEMFDNFILALNSEYTGE